MDIAATIPGPDVGTFFGDYERGALGKHPRNGGLWERFLYGGRAHLSDTVTRATYAAGASTSTR